MTETLSGRLGALRLRAGQPSLRAIAALPGISVSHTTIAEMLNGKTVPRWDTVATVAEALGATEKDLLDLSRIWQQLIARPPVDPLDMLRRRIDVLENQPLAGLTGKLPLVGLTEIAQRAGVQRPVVTTWRRRYPDFPESAADLHTGPVFWWPSVRDWLTATGRDSDCALTVAEINQSKSDRPPVRERLARPV